MRAYKTLTGETVLVNERDHAQLLREYGPEQDACICQWYGKNGLDCGECPFIKAYPGKGCAQFKQEAGLIGQSYRIIYFWLKAIPEERT